MISVMKQSFYHKLHAMGATVRLESPIVKVKNGELSASTDDGSKLFYKDIRTNKTYEYKRPLDEADAPFVLFQSRLMSGYSEEVGANEYYNSRTPKCKLTSSMPFSTKYRAEMCASYKKRAQTTSSAKKGDWVEFRFDEPVKCTYLCIATGFEHMQASLIYDGHLEVCYDGEEFVNVGALDHGYFVLQPKNRPIHALRVVSDGISGGAGRIDIQPLIIK
jgi:hypothetical protein